MKKYVTNRSFYMVEPMKLKDAPKNVVPFEVYQTNEMDGYLMEDVYGNKSWCSRGYLEDNFTIYDSFVDKMKLELDELDERIEKLEKFIESDSFMSLEETDRNLLNEQLQAMHSYLCVLSCRMKRATSN